MALIAGAVAGLFALALAGLGPVVVIGFCVTIAVLTFAFARPLWGLTLALTLMPFERMVLPAGVLQLTASDLLGIVAAAGWILARLAGSGRTPLTIPTPVFAPMVLLMCSFIPSTILAPAPGEAAQQFLGWANFFALAWMVAAEARLQDIRLLLGALALSGGIAGVLTVLDPTIDLLGRAAGPFGQPNTLGSFLALTMPAQIYFVIAGSTRERLLACLGLLTAIYALSVSLSRSAWVGLLAMGVLLLVWRPFRLAAAVAAVVAVFLMVSGLNPVSNVIDVDEIGERIASISDPSTDQAQTLRREVWSESPQMIADHPLGIGARNFGEIAGDYGLGYFPFNTPVGSAENMVLTLGVEQGLIAIVALVWLCVACGSVLLWIWRSGDREARLMGLTLSAILVSLLVIGLFNYGLHSNPITLSAFIVIGCAVALKRVIEEDPPPAEEPEHELQWPAQPAARVAASVGSGAR